MRATPTIPRDLLENQDQFTDPFFKRFTLRSAPPLDLGDGIQKQYSFPTFYHDVGCAIGIFMCDYEAARALMPHEKIVPVRMPKGRTLVMFSCYEYRHVMGVAPYNEIAMTIPVLANASLRLPVLPLLASALFPRFGYYVFSMPVTSKENQIRGNKIWGLPKVTQDIDIEVREGDSVTTAKDEHGENYFELKVPTSGTPTDFDVKGNLYSKLDGRVRKAVTCFQGNFAVNKYMRALTKKGLEADRPYLKIGAQAKVLNALQIESHPFQFRYTPSMNAAFDLPIPDFDIDR